MSKEPELPSRMPLMKAFLICIVVQVVLLVLLVAGVWKYTDNLLKREAALASEVLPNLELAHHFISATAGLQSQGLLLRGSETLGDLKLRKQLLEGSIRETKALIQSPETLGAFDTVRLESTIDQVQEVVIGLSDIRGLQLRAGAELKRAGDSRVKEIESLTSVVQTRVVALTDRLLDKREFLDNYSGQRIDAFVDSEYKEALDGFESDSLAIEDYLFFNADLLALKSLVERLPLMQAEADVSLAEQSRDLLLQSMVSRAIYIHDDLGEDFLLIPLKDIREHLRGSENIFERRLSVLQQNELQKELSARLAQLTIEVPAVTDQIRSQSAAVLVSISSETRLGLERYRLFLFGVLVLFLLVLGSISYWLLYRRTVLPLGELVGQLDDVGTEQFAQRNRGYFIREIDELANAVCELDEVQKQMQRKDIELNASNHELRRANDDLEQFVHVASHDLQEPLRKLQQFSGLLNEDYESVLDEDGKFYLDTISKSARRMSTMIRDTLEYARSARAQQVVEVVNLAKLIDTVCADMDVAVAEAGAQITVGELPQVKANPTGMAQLFGNLLLNAVKYRRDDVPCQIHVDARYSDDRQSIQIKIEDNGIGIESQYIDRVFVPFERLKSQSVSGTGLGLAICTKVCDAHDWKMTLTSEEGVGSCFVIAVPIKDIAN